PGPGAPVSRGSGGVRHDRGLRPRAFEIAGHRAGERLDIEPSARRRACRFDRTAQFPDDMAAETAIALHLGFAEPLVGRALMRELLVERRIGTDVGRLAAVKPRFHIDQGSGLFRRVRVADPTQCAVDAVYRRVLPRLHVEAVELDANPEVDS